MVARKQKGRGKRHASQGRAAKAKRKPSPTKKTKPRNNGKHPGGRPPWYDDPAVLAADCEAYIQDCEARQIQMQVEGKDGDIHEVSISKCRPPSPAGLRLFLGKARGRHTMPFQTLSDYSSGKYGEEFSEPLLAVKDWMEQWWSIQGAEGKNPTFSRFMLSAAFGLVEKTAQEHTGSEGGPMNINIVTQMAMGDGKK